MGAAQHRILRRRSGEGHDLWRERGRGIGVAPDGIARREGPVRHARSSPRAAAATTGRRWPRRRRRGEAFGTRAGAADAAALRALPADKVLGGIALMSKEDDRYSGPMTDGTIVPAGAETIFAEGKQARIPYIIGSNDDELGFIPAPFRAMVNGPVEKALGAVRRYRQGSLRQRRRSKPAPRRRRDVRRTGARLWSVAGARGRADLALSFRLCRRRPAQARCRRGPRRRMSRSSSATCPRMRPPPTAPRRSSSAITGPTSRRPAIPMAAGLPVWAAPRPGVAAVAFDRPRRDRDGAGHDARAHRHRGGTGRKMMKDMTMRLSALIAGALAIVAIPACAWEVIRLSSDPVPATSKEVRETGPFGTIVRNVSDATLTPYVADKPNGTAVIVAPGGGFHMLSIDNEGEAVAKWLNSQGVTAFVLKYRPARNRRRLSAPDDALSRQSSFPARRGRAAAPARDRRWRECGEVGAEERRPLWHQAEPRRADGLFGRRRGDGVDAGGEQAREAAPISRSPSIPDCCPTRSRCRRRRRRCSSQRRRTTSWRMTTACGSPPPGKRPGRARGSSPMKTEAMVSA